MVSNPILVNNSSSSSVNIFNLPIEESVVLQSQRNVSNINSNGQPLNNPTENYPIVESRETPECFKYEYIRPNSNKFDYNRIKSIKFNE